MWCAKEGERERINTFHVGCYDAITGLTCGSGKDGHITPRYNDTAAGKYHIYIWLHVLNIYMALSNLKSIYTQECILEWKLPDVIELQAHSTFTFRVQNIYIQRLALGATMEEAYDKGNTLELNL